MQSRETQITMVKWTNAGGQTKPANEWSFVYHPPAWRRWRNVKTTYCLLFSVRCRLPLKWVSRKLRPRKLIRPPKSSLDGRGFSYTVSSFGQVLKSDLCEKLPCRTWEKTSGTRDTPNLENTDPFNIWKTETPQKNWLENSDTHSKNNNINCKTQILKPPSLQLCNNIFSFSFWTWIWFLWICLHLTK